MERNRRLSVLTKKLFLLYSLNVADWICTVILLSREGFFELNPLMRGVLGNVSLGFLLKCIVPAAAVTALLRMFAQPDADVPLIVGRCVSAVLIFYVFLCANHVFNFLILFLRGRT